MASGDESNFYTALGRSLHRQQDKKSPHRQKISLGETLRRLREKAGLSGVELCRRSGGLDPKTLSAIEKGRIQSPSLESLQQIASGLGCLVRDFFTRAEMALERNYHVGSAKGVYQMEFPKLGLKVISATPPIPQFFCGKLILGPQRKISGDLLARPVPLFFEVVMGRIECTLEGETVTLKEGENLLLNGGFRHSFRNILNRESTLWLVTAPSFIGL